MQVDPNRQMQAARVGETEALALLIALDLRDDYLPGDSQNRQPVNSPRVLEVLRNSWGAERYLHFRDALAAGLSRRLFREAVAKDQVLAGRVEQWRCGCKSRNLQLPSDEAPLLADEFRRKLGLATEPEVKFDPQKRCDLYRMFRQWARYNGRDVVLRLTQEVAAEVSSSGGAGPRVSDKAANQHRAVAAGPSGVSPSLANSNLAKAVASIPSTAPVKMSSSLANSNLAKAVASLSTPPGSAAGQSTAAPGRQPAPSEAEAIPPEAKTQNADGKPSTGTPGDVFVPEQPGSEASAASSSSGNTGQVVIEPPPVEPVVPVVPVAPPAPAKSLWKYLPVPDDPDKHDEYYAQTWTAPDGRLVIGARVRGKKHKHEGTNCDDWFEYAVAGKWSIVAVSDGGGSYKFSRVGSQAACRASVSYLKEKLSGIVLRRREKLEAGMMSDEDMKAAVAALQEAMKQGWSGVERAFRDRENDKRHYKSLENRDLTLRDLQCTLLVVIQTTIETAVGPQVVALSCSVGDGMMVAVSRSGACSLLMDSDSGEFSGETKFLEPRWLTDGELAGRTRSFAGGIRAILAMTDGVADDYFPENPEMARLYADLVLNGVIPAPRSEGVDVEAEIRATKLQSREQLADADWFVELDRVLPEFEKVRIASASQYADILGLAGSELAAKPKLLWAALQSQKKPMPGVEKPEERLLVWLDTYYARTSFDDRTLVVITGEPSS